MSVEIKEGSLLDTSDNIIGHVTNVKGVWGAGIAPQIGEKFKGSYKAHSDYCKAHDNSWEKLKGNIQVIMNDKIILNIFAMPEIRSFSHHAFSTSLHLFKAYQNLNSNPSLAHDKKISLPYGIGCGLAGGDINVVNKIIHDWSIDCDYKVTLWAYNKAEWKKSIDEWEVKFKDESQSKNINPSER